jgi:hypothetical protein
MVDLQMIKDKNIVFLGSDSVRALTFIGKIGCTSGKGVHMRHSETCPKRCYKHVSSYFLFAPDDL